MTKNEKAKFEKKIKALEVTLDETIKSKAEMETKLNEQQRKLTELQHINALYQESLSDYRRLEAVLESVREDREKAREATEYERSLTKYAQEVANRRQVEIVRLVEEGKTAAMMLREVMNHYGMPASQDVRNFILASVAAMLEGDFHPYNVNNPRHDNTYDVYLTDCRYKIGAKRISMIKAIREITNLGLKEAKELTDPAYEEFPRQSLLARGVDRETAVRWRNAIDESACRGFVEPPL